MPLEPGRIILIHYPFSDGTSAKVRPALVVSRTKFNHGEDVVVVPISSRVDKNEKYGYHVLDTEPFFASTQLRMSSTVRWSKPMTISDTVIIRKLGSVPQDVLVAIVNEIRDLLPS